MVPTTTVAEQQQQKFDSYSFSNYMDFEVLDMDLDLSVNFECKKLDGRVHLKIKCLLDSSGEERKDLILDVNKLTVTKVCGCHPNGSGNKMKELQFKIDEQMKFGQALTISLSPDLIEKHSIFHVTIYYSTSPEAPALQWLSSELTLGKKLPFMFSQCQAIHCRSMVPCQDTPSIKSTYTAIIRVKPGFQVLMSAQFFDVTTGESQQAYAKRFKRRSVDIECCPVTGCYKRVTATDTDLDTLYGFEQKNPIPSYLIALAVGHLQYRTIGPRSRVWAEPESLDLAAFEFSEVEEMLVTAESIMGPYDWSHYDLLVLPPSFPYGGMENPCLTFVTPTIIAGDQSEVYVIAHEIIHSWCGNSFSNKTWEHFWLNEGHTKFIEGKIMQKLRGDDFENLFRYYGYKSMLRGLETAGANSSLTKLVPDLSTTFPEDYFTQIPFEKGSAFLQHVESFVGEQRMLDFLRKIAEKYQYRSLDSDDYKNEMADFFGDTIINLVHWDDWMFIDGYPEHYRVNERGKQLHQPVIDLAKNWTNGTDVDDEIFKNLNPMQKQAFLEELCANSDKISQETLVKMDEKYRFNDSESYSMRGGWLHLCSRVQHKPSLTRILTFIEDTGRMKYLRNIYSALANWPYAKPISIQHFKQHRSNMHPVAIRYIERVLLDK